MNLRFLLFLAFVTCWFSMTFAQSAAGKDSLASARDSTHLAQQVEEVVVSATLTAISAMESPVPVAVYTPAFLRKTTVPSLFEAVQLMNGVRPQLNCSVCGTGDIHINGLEGPYTLVLIDGMPIVSGLGTVYGLNGIPTGMIERIEVVKGPASSLYGSEAVGGLINVITKSPEQVPRLTVEQWATSHGEASLDAGARLKLGPGNLLLGLNGFGFQSRRDVNDDGFTDIPLTARLSTFAKWAHTNGHHSLAVRWLAEDRWGGQLGWNSALHGSDSVYGEHIVTQRWEVLGRHQHNTLPLTFSYSLNEHRQDAAYGATPYLAVQRIGFGQAVWEQKLGDRHAGLAGLAVRGTFYDDNTPATSDTTGTNRADAVVLPGLFVQDEWRLHESHTLLGSLRLDWHPVHGRVWSPRVAWRFSPTKRHVLRINAGNGFRTVSLFTEEHAALTGAREVVIAEALKPERSWNANVHYAFQLRSNPVTCFGEVSAFYTHFTNKILPDYATDPNKILYANLDGWAVSRGIGLNSEWVFSIPMRINLGATWMQVFQVSQSGPSQARQPQVHAPPFSGTFTASYTFARLNAILDWTGNVYSPMPLPVVPGDFRPDRSPWYSLQNLQFTKRYNTGFQWFIGAKNLLNFLPANPLLRPFDPFDRNISLDNPQGYTFDTAYGYAPVQGRRYVAGFRWSWVK